MIGRRAQTTIVVAALAALVAGTACKRVPVVPSEPVFYPSPPDQPRIQYLRSFSSQRDIQRKKKYAWVDFIVGPSETENRGFVKVYGVGVAPGKFYACDTILGMVWVVDFLQGTFNPIIGNRGQGKLKKPINVTVTEDGTKYVADIERQQIVVFGPDDRFTTAFGGVGEFKPGSVRVAGNRIINTDLVRQEVQIRDRATGKILRTFGSPESSPLHESLGMPVNIVLDGRGNILVSDSGRFRVSVHSLDGDFLGTFGQLGRRPGQFARPKGIAVDRAGVIYVVDAAFENVQMFNEAHKLLMWFGGSGNEDGAMSLPAQITLDYENVDYFRQYVAPGYDLEFIIWVTNQTGLRRVSCYGFLKPAGKASATKSLTKAD